MNKEAVNIDWPTVLKFMAGGALGGAGIAATTKYIRHMNALNEKAKKEKAMREGKPDDNTLVLNLPASYGKQASHTKQGGPLTLALGGIGMLGSGVASHELVRELYNAHRKAELKKELENAQRIYIEDLQEQAKQRKESSHKEGKSQFDWLDYILGGAGAGLGLTALGTFGLTNKLLDKYFPAPQDPKRLQPERVRIRTMTEEEGRDPDKGRRAGEDHSPVDDSDSLEGLLRVHMADPGKRASAGGMADVITAVAHGRGGELVDTLNKTASTEAMFNAVKGAAQEPAPRWRNFMAASWLTRRPGIKEAFAPYIVAEIADTSPGFCKMARNVDPDALEHLVGLFKGASAATTANGYTRLFSKIEGIDKQAAPISMDDLMLSSALEQLLSKPEEPQGEEASPTPDNSGADVPDSEDSRDSDELGVDFDIQDEDALRFMRQYGDDIEDILARAGNQ